MGKNNTILCVKISIVLLVILLVLNSVICEESTTSSSAQSLDSMVKVPEDATKKIDGNQISTSMEKFGNYEYKDIKGETQKLEGVKGTIVSEQEGKGVKIKDMDVEVGKLGENKNYNLNRLSSPVAEGSKITGGGENFKVSPPNNAVLYGEPKKLDSSSNTEVKYLPNTGEKVKFVDEKTGEARLTVGRIEKSLSGEVTSSGGIKSRGEGFYFTGSENNKEAGTAVLNGDYVINSDHSNPDSINNIYTDGASHPNNKNPYISTKEREENGGERAHDKVVVMGSPKGMDSPFAVFNYDPSHEKFLAGQAIDGSELDFRTRSVSRVFSQVPEIIMKAGGDNRANGFYTNGPFSYRLTTDQYGKTSFTREPSGRREGTTDLETEFWRNDGKSLFADDQSYVSIQGRDRTIIEGINEKGIQISSNMPNTEKLFISSMRMTDRSIFKDKELGTLTPAERYGTALINNPIFTTTVVDNQNNPVRKNFFDSLLGVSPGIGGNFDKDQFRADLYSPPQLQNPDKFYYKYPLAYLVGSELRGLVASNSPASKEAISASINNFIDKHDTGNIQDLKKLLENYPWLKKPEYRDLFSAKMQAGIKLVEITGGK